MGSLRRAGICMAIAASVAVAAPARLPSTYKDLGDKMAMKTVEQPAVANAPKVEPIPNVLKNFFTPATTGHLAKKAATDDSTYVTAKISVNEVVFLPGMSSTYLGFGISTGSSPYLMFVNGGTAENPDIFSFSKLYPNVLSGPGIPQNSYSGGIWASGPNGAYYSLIAVADTSAHPSTCQVTMQKSQWSDLDAFNSGIMQGATLSIGSGAPQSKSIFGNTARLDSIGMSENGPVASMTIGGTAFPAVFDGQSVLLGNVRYMAMAVGKDVDGAGFLNLGAFRDKQVVLTANGCTVTVDDYVDLKNISIGLMVPVGSEIPPIPYLTYGRSADFNLNGKMYRLTIHPEDDTSYIATLTPLDVSVRSGAIGGVKIAPAFVTQLASGMCHFNTDHTVNVYNTAGKLMGSLHPRKGDSINVGQQLRLAEGTYVLRDAEIAANTVRIQIFR